MEGIPIQFGQGRETIYPSAALSEYEDACSRFRDRLREARSLNAWKAICLEEWDAYSKAKGLSHPREYGHIRCLHDAFVREATALREWRQGMEWPMPRWGERIDTLEQMLDRGEITVRQAVESSETFRDAHIHPYIEPAPLAVTGSLTFLDASQSAAPHDEYTGDRRLAAQGQFRPSGWHAVGPHPGYTRPPRPSPAGSPTRGARTRGSRP